MLKRLWPGDIQGAKEVQDALRKEVKIIPLRKTPSTVGAVDAAFFNDSVVAVATLYSFPAMEHLEDAVVIEETLFPYVPGFLAFREGHAAVTALKKLKRLPGLVLIDGQGIAHPRGIGIASQIGVVIERPTIGCAKSRLVGDFEEPGGKKGSWTYLHYRGARVGAVLRTRKDVKPLFVSPGHMIDIPASIEIVMRSLSLYRIPEPLRRADLLSKRIRSVGAASVE